MPSRLIRNFVGLDDLMVYVISSTKTDDGEGRFCESRKMLKNSIFKVSTGCYTEGWPFVLASMFKLNRPVVLVLPRRLRHL